MPELAILALFLLALPAVELASNAAERWVNEEPWWPLW